MKKIYTTPEVEIVERLDVVTTSATVESERIPLYNIGTLGVVLEEIFNI